MNIYPIYLLDYQRYRAFLPSKLTDIETAEQVYSILYSQEDKPNPRFIRLAECLERAYPPAHGDLAADATDEEIEAYHDMDESIWINSPMTDLNRQRNTALWQPDLEIGNLIEIMPRLIPLARQLGIDVYDKEQGIYLPANGMPIPARKGSEYRLSYDLDIASHPEKCHFSQPMQQQTFIESFAPVLLEEGFESVVALTPDALSYKFTRSQDDNLQSIMLIFHPAGCDILMNMKNERYKAIQALSQDRPASGVVFSFSFNHLRLYAASYNFECYWQSMDEIELLDISNKERVAWLVSDFRKYALPILNKALTVSGMDWLFNSDNWSAAGHFPLNIRRPDRMKMQDHFDQDDYAQQAVYYAYLAKNPDADNIVELLRDQFKEATEASLKRFEACVDYCKNNLSI